MTVTISQSKTALAPGLNASFLATGGTGPYTYAVLAGGAGGSIDSNGLYLAPSVVNADPAKASDTIRATDHVGATVTASILVGDPVTLLCEILQREMSLADGRVYIWNQKLFQPSDNDLYIIATIASGKIFGSQTRVNASGNAEQVLNMMATVDLDIMSRGPSARTRKEEVLLALSGIYSQAQQEANSFAIGRIPAGARIVNLSGIDGAAIPFRFRISVNVQYAATKSKAVEIFDTFSDVTTTIEP